MLRFPQRTSTLRPYLALNLINSFHSVRCYALIDSGADDSVFPASFAKQLGLDFAQGRHYPFGGAADGNQDAYFFDLDVEVVGITRYSASVGFSAALEKWGHGLLGQNGFFDRFPLEFDLPSGIFALHTRELSASRVAEFWLPGRSCMFPRSGRQRSTRLGRDSGLATRAARGLTCGVGAAYHFALGL